MGSSLDLIPEQWLRLSVLDTRKTAIIMGVPALSLHLVNKALLDADDVFQGDIRSAEFCSARDIIGCWT